MSPRKGRAQGEAACAQGNGWLMTRYETQLSDTGDAIMADDPHRPRQRPAAQESPVLRHAPGAPR
jgi:hypothetical protein